jgi:hypothetical protein
VIDDGLAGPSGKSGAPDHASQRNFRSGDIIFRFAQFSVYSPSKLSTLDAPRR